jgi:DnaJ domain
VHAYRPNHYEALGVPPNADGEAIRAAWREQAKQLHPDLSDGSGSESKEAFLRLQEAYDVLRDPDRRAHYDATLARETAMAEAARLAARRQPSRPPRFAGLGSYLAALALVVLVTAGIVAWQIYFPLEPQRTGKATVIARVVRDDRPASPLAATAPERPAEPGALTREVDHAVQAQIERVEAAKKKLETQLSELDARKPHPGTTRPKSRRPWWPSACIAWAPAPASC